MTISEAFAVLGLKGRVTRSEVRNAYLDLVKVWHPDRFGTDPRLQAKAQAQLKAINAAYGFLASDWEGEPRVTSSKPAPPPFATTTSSERTRSAPRWVLWAALLGLTWRGALALSTSPNRTTPTPPTTASAITAIVSGDRKPPAEDQRPTPARANPRPDVTIDDATSKAVPCGAAKPDPGDEIFKEIDELLRPENGQELELSSDVEAQDIGLGEFIIENGTNLDAVMVLFRDGVQKRAFYIRATKSAALTNIGANSYVGRFMLGTTWSAAEFSCDQQFLEFVKPIVFIEKTDAGGTTTSRISVTLHTVRGGNARANKVPRFRLGIRPVSR